MPATWIWRVQLQDVKSQDGKRLSFERTAELPTLPQAGVSHQAAFFPGTGFRMIMTLASQVVILEEGAVEAVFNLDRTALINASTCHSAALIEMFEFAGWELLAVDGAVIPKRGQS